jgi:integrase/recombinase XerC
MEAVPKLEIIQNFTSTKIKKGRSIKKDKFPTFIEEFAEFLLHQNYAATTVESHKIKSRKFCRILKEISNISISTLSDCNQITKKAINSYVIYLNDQIRQSKLQPYSAYCDMKTVRLFIKFLYYKKLIDFKYEIPKNLIVSPNRSNLYVDKQSIIQLAESIMQNEKIINKMRNLSLFLLLVETGCRPIEASNLLISDINFTEKFIRLYSIKSGTRTLKLDNFVLNVLKEYSIIRENLNPTSEHFFIKNDGTKVTRNYLSSKLTLENKKAFGYNKINSRVLRHTYITNAIDNNNDFVKLSETVGHKHWVSTMYYLHRDKNRMLQQTLPFNPIPNLKGEID